MKTGDAIEFLNSQPITREQLRAYADASGDFNPIHLDEAVAKQMGLPGIIAHGMLSAAFIADRAEQFAQGTQFKLLSLQTRFKAMVHVGDSVSVGGMVKEFNDKSLVLDLQAKNQRGEIATIGTARFALKS